MRRHVNIFISHLFMAFNGGRIFRIKLQLRVEGRIECHDFGGGGGEGNCGGVAEQNCFLIIIMRLVAVNTVGGERSGDELVEPEEE